MGYWILGGLAGLGWGWGGGESPALWFWVIEVAVMMPRARQGLEWYRGRFGRRAVGGRWGVLPGVV